MCTINKTTKRCRLIKGKEKPNDNCHFSKTGRCVKQITIDRTKCGMNNKTKRCNYLRSNEKANKKCKLSKFLKRCVKA